MDDVWMLHADEIILDWKILRPLGRGGMGEIYLVQRLSHASFPYALKLFTAAQTTDAFFKQRFIAMGETLLQIAHPSLSKVLYVGTLQRDGVDYPFMIMTFIGMSQEAYTHLLSSKSQQEVPSCNGETYTLADMLTHPMGVSISWLERWFQEVADGLKHLHTVGFAHGDIKPTNILIGSSGRAVLIDFGLSSALKAQVHPPGYETTQHAFKASTVFRGTPAFTAPELLTGGTPTEASDWYSLGATFFFARTGVHYYPSKPTQMLIESMEAPWRERFQRLLHVDPMLRQLQPEGDSTSRVVPPPKRSFLKGWKRCLLSLLFGTLLGAFALWGWKTHFAAHLGVNDQRLSPSQDAPSSRAPTPTLETMPAEAPMPQSEAISYSLLDISKPVHLKAHTIEHLSTQSSVLPLIQLEAHSTLTLRLDTTDRVVLDTCQIHPDATLIIGGTGELCLERNEAAVFEGTLRLAKPVTVAIKGYHPHTLPKIITEDGTHLSVALGNNQTSSQLFSSLDMSQGGTLTGYGIRFYLEHNATETIPLGNNAQVDLPWVACRGGFHAVSGNNEVRGLNAHLWKAFWLSADAGATLTFSGDRFYMFDHWRGEDLYITPENKGTIIFDYREFAPLCKFQMQGGTTLLRCDMTQDFEKNWCTRKWANDWIVHPMATLAGNTTLTFHEQSALVVNENGCLSAGENGGGTFAANRVILEAGARLRATGNARFDFNKLILKGPITLDLSGCTTTSPLSWEALEGIATHITCLYLPPGKKIIFTSTGITLQDE